MKAILIDVYDNTSEEILTAETWDEMYDKIRKYVKDVLNFESYYMRIMKHNESIRVDFGSHYKFIDLDVPYLNEIEKNPAEDAVAVQDPEPKEERRAMSIVDLLEKFKDLLVRADVQGSKIVSKTEIRRLMSEIDRTLHYM